MTRNLAQPTMITSTIPLSLTSELPPELLEPSSLALEICHLQHSRLLIVERRNAANVVWVSPRDHSDDTTRSRRLHKLLTSTKTGDRTSLTKAIEEAIAHGSSKTRLRGTQRSETVTSLIVKRLSNSKTPPHLCMLVLKTRTEAGNLLRDHAKNLLQGVEQAGEGFALTDQAGCFTYLNRVHVEIFGYQEQAELIGKSWKSLYSPEEADRLEREVMPNLAKTGTWSGSALARRKDGSEFHEALTLSLTPNGQVACICQDRTQEMNSIKTLQDREELFRKVVENLPSGLLIREMEGKYIYANKVARDVGWARPIEPIGKRPEEIFPPEILEQLRSVPDAALEGDRVLRKDIEWDLGSERKTIEMLKFLIPNPGSEHEDSVCNIWTDVTERRTVEASLREMLEQKSQSLTMQRQFISTISHEFRSPMAAIQGAAALMEMTLGSDLPEKIARYLEIQRESLGTLGDLVDQVLLINRLEQAVAEPSLNPLDITEFVHGIREYFNDSAQSSRVRVDLPEAPIGLVSVDDSLLKSALENLLSNAVKYSPRGSPIVITLGRNTDSLEISVKDSGIGIPADELSRLGEAFFRARNVGSVPGTGLGLKIVKRCIDLHQGTLEFTSREKSGSTFTIKIPVK